MPRLSTIDVLTIFVPRASSADFDEPSPCSLGVYPVAPSLYSTVKVLPLVGDRYVNHIPNPKPWLSPLPEDGVFHPLDPKPRRHRRS
jgi:hypothetical protein